ncbi:hypothetical protein [Actinophytocola xanthii]|uniref:hypothetical protein n=1 Tax=Actinophytocola xanthii TaxID=1912961 RepID=UPI0009F8861C|nr:hypothetical protein [Actinophytocola xanthii]
MTGQLDPVTAEYNRRCAAGDRALAESMSRARLPPALVASMRDRFLPRPFFIPRPEILGLADRVVALLDLLLSVPDRFFGGDRERYARAVGMDPRRAGYLAPFTGRPELYGRADLYHDGESLRLLELNVGSALGGLDRAQISAALLEVPAFHAFAAEHGLGFVDTGVRVDRALRAAAAPLCGGRSPLVAFVDGNGAMAPYLHLATSFQEMLAGFGVEVLLAELGDVGFAGGRATVHGRPVDVVLRYFGVGDVLDDPAGLRVVDSLVRADAEGAVVLFSSLAGELYNNKRSLALLAELRGELTEDEVALADELLPWTRTMTPDLLEHCLAHGAELILKPGADFGGQGIVAGWQTDELDWKRALTAAVDQGAIVQRRVVPRAEPVLDPATGRSRDWHAVWDCFLTPEGYAGSHIRALPAGADAVIGMGVTEAARTTGIFYYDGV